MAGMAQSVGGCLVHRKVAGSFQVKAHTGVSGSISTRGRAGGSHLIFCSHIDVFFLPSSFFKNQFKKSKKKKLDHFIEQRIN